MRCRLFQSCWVAALAPILVVVTGGALLPASAQFAFQAELNVPVGCAPDRIESGDFDGDGLADVVMACDQLDELRVAWGQESHVLGQATAIWSGESVHTLVVADFDGDGHDDIAAGFFGIAEVWVHLSNGDRTFAPGIRVTLASYASDLAALDVNHDGYLDLIASGSSPHAITPFYGTGDGNFTAGSAIATIDYPWRIRSGDFDDDGVDDIIVTSFSVPTLEFFRGLPSGDFAPAVDHALSAPARELLVGDFDSDGLLDAATICTYDCWQLTIQRGDGSGAFTARPTLSLPDDTAAALAIDFDTDGHLDIAIVRSAADALVLYTGSGDGGFVEQPPRLAGLEPQGLVAADVDGDAFLDLVATHLDGQSLSQFRRKPGGSFVDIGTAYTGTPLRDLLFSDFNGDGHVDLVCRFGGLSTLLGDGQGHFIVRDTTPTVTSGDLVLGDFDRDGVEDVVVLPYTLSTFAYAYMHRIDADGDFLPQTLFALPGTDHAGCAGDFDGDGHLDLVVVAANATSYINQGLYFYRGLGDGTFAASVHFDDTTDLESVLSADFDGDGNLDLVAMTCYATGLVFGGAGDGTFVQSASVSGHGSVCNLDKMAIGDFDGNGYPDICVHGNGMVTVLPSMGASGFGFPVSVPAPGSNRIVAADFDVDGRDDLAVAGSGLVFLQGDASALLTDTGFAIGGGSGAFGASDVDGDGAPDIVQGWYNGIEVNRNETLDPPDCDGDGIADVDEVDLDGDGVPDDCQGRQAFTRGDCNRDGSIDIADPIYVEGYLFLSGATPGCRDACDTNDDGQLDIADSIYSLSWLFAGGATLPAPIDACGHDPSEDSLDCQSYPTGLCP